MHSAWMHRSDRPVFSGSYSLPIMEDLDPDPTKRPQLYSGQPDLDQQLTAAAISPTRLHREHHARFRRAAGDLRGLAARCLWGYSHREQRGERCATAHAAHVIDTGLVASLPSLLRFGKSTRPSSAFQRRHQSTIAGCPTTFLTSVYPPTQSTSVRSRLNAQSEGCAFFHDSRLRCVCSTRLWRFRRHDRRHDNPGHAQPGHNVYLRRGDYDRSDGRFFRNAHKQPARFRGR